MIAKAQSAFEDRWGPRLTCLCRDYQPLASFNRLRTNGNSYQLLLTRLCETGLSQVDEADILVRLWDSLLGPPSARVCGL